MQSCIYEGCVVHRRRGPVKHRFRYRLSMVYLDLDELPTLLGPRGLIRQRRFAAASFRPEDHLALAAAGGSARRAAATAREVVRRETGFAPDGPVRLLTQLRYWGYYFSPLNLYYCFSNDQSRLDAIVAEVSNTPWKEQHLYVLWAGNRSAGEARAGGQTSGASIGFSHAKAFHVSPFMDMEMRYDWRLTRPAKRLQVAVTNVQEGSVLFEAGLSLARRPLTSSGLAQTMLRYPWMTGQITAAIYFQAFKLWWKACPSYPHPNKQAQLAQSA